MNVFRLRSGLTEEKLERIKQRTRLSPSELCTAIALLSMAEAEGEENVMLHWIFQNRITPASENAAGMVIRLLPVGARIPKGADIDDVLHQVAVRIRDGIANSEGDWCLDHESVFQNDALLLVYEASIMDMESMKERNALSEILPNPDGATVRRAYLQVFATEKGLLFRFVYVEALFEAAHIEAFRKAMEKWDLLRMRER